MELNSASDKPVILVADDDEMMLEICGFYLGKSGYSVVPAINGVEALQSFRHTNPALVLLDGSMPHMDGFQTCKAIKEISGIHSVPVIMVTALNDEQSVKKAFEAGAEEYITKPIHWAVLEQRIRLLLKQRQAEQTAYWAHQSQRLINALLQTGDPTISLTEQLQQSLDMILKISWLPLDGKGAIFLLDQASQTLILTVHTNLSDYVLSRCSQLPVGNCLCGLAASSQQIVFANHVDERHVIRDAAMDDHGHYCIPIRTSTTLLGVINLYIQAGMPHDARLQSTLLTIGSTLANMIKRKRMEEEIKYHHDQLAYERAFIEEIITRMRASKSFDSTRLRLLQNPVEKTTGDLVLAAFRPDGVQHILLGDFTGHGLPAAIGGPMTAAIFYSMTNKGFPAAEILTEINQKLKDKTPVGMFMAAGVLQWDASRKKLTIWNCSIPDILIFRNNTLHHRVESSHFACGIVNLVDSPGIELEVELGDRVFAYSDGFIEEKNEDGKLFGRTAFERLLTQILTLDEPLELLIDVLQDYRGQHHEQSDDITMIELTC